jgi:hypothetical protein
MIGAAPEMATPAGIEATVALEDPVLRNLRITLTYHDLTHALTRILGDRNLSWCSFGCWASKTAGTFIRRELLPAFWKDLLEETLPVLLDGKLQPALRALGSGAAPGKDLIERTLTRALGPVAGEIALGNLMVFAEIGGAFARFVEAAGDCVAPDPARIERFLRGFRSGPPEAGGQDLLREAFASFVEAAYEQDPKRKAELVLLGNLLVGYQSSGGCSGTSRDRSTRPSTTCSSRSSSAPSGP